MRGESVSDQPSAQLVRESVGAGLPDCTTTGRLGEGADAPAPLLATSMRLANDAAGPSRPRRPIAPSPRRRARCRVGRPCFSRFGGGVSECMKRRFDASARPRGFGQRRPQSVRRSSKEAISCVRSPRSRRNDGLLAVYPGGAGWLTTASVLRHTRLGVERIVSSWEPVRDHERPRRVVVATADLFGRRIRDGDPCL